MQHIFLNLELQFLCAFNITLNALIETSRLLFSSFDKQCGPRSDCSYRSSVFRVTLFASLLNSSVMLGNYLQQTTSADDIFRCIFFLGVLRVSSLSISVVC